MHPIETHPHDGSRTLVFYCENGKAIWTALAVYLDVKGRKTEAGKGWWWKNQGEEDACALSPTHWAPIPPASCD